MSQRTAVLFLTHVWDPIIRIRFERLAREIGERADVLVLTERSSQTRAALRQHPPSRRAIGFSAAELVELLGFSTLEEGTLVPGSTHFPLLGFATGWKAYDRFLVIEFDVEFSGNWGDLLDEILAAGVDFAAAHVRTHAEVPDWHHWPTLVPAEADRAWAADPANLRRSFNPVFFLTRAAVDHVRAAHEAGWRGHYECLVPTIVAHRGCATLDIAADERFCLGTDQDWAEDQPEGALSTMRWRPPIKPSEFKARKTGSTLFHPIKGPWYYDGKDVRGLLSRYSGKPSDEPTEE